MAQMKKLIPGFVQAMEPNSHYDFCSVETNDSLEKFIRENVREGFVSVSSDGSQFDSA